MTEFLQSWQFLSAADLRFLASPTFDLGTLAIPLILFATVFYRNNRHWDDRYWKMIGLVSDVLSIVGIIGLAATVGRTLLDESVRDLTLASEQAERALQIDLERVTFAFCVPPRAEIGPTPTNLLCEDVRDLEGTGKTKRPQGLDSPELNLEAERTEFVDFPPNSADVRLVRVAHLVARHVESLDQARIAVRQAEFDRTTIPALTSSKVLLTCLVFALLGLCLKLAPSIREVRVAQNGGKPLPKLPFWPAWVSRRSRSQKY
jgi:hypothetical protein